MSDTTILEQPTLQSIAFKLSRVKARLEDMEDLMELRAAVERNADRPAASWEQVKAEMGFVA